MYAASPFRLLLLTAVTGVLAEDASAQQEAHAHSDDYGQWETLGQGVLSPDGQWLAVGISRVNDEDELRIHHTASDSRPERGSVRALDVGRVRCSVDFWGRSLGFREDVVYFQTTHLAEQARPER